MIVDVALGIVFGYILLAVLKRPIDSILGRLWNTAPLAVSRTDTGTTVSPQLEMYDSQDWLDLWTSMPEAAKSECRRILEDDDLRRRVQQSDEDLGLWPYLWSFASDDTKALIQNRWLKPQKNSPQVKPS